ncbi:MAG: hypothetical protein Q9170_005683 [Blastenia crenularia]
MISYGSKSYPAPNFHKRVDPDTSTASNNQDQGEGVSSGPSTPASSHFPTVSPSDVHSSGNLPSSSGPFSPITFPAGWEAYPMDSLFALRPATIAATYLEAFYTNLLSHAAQNVWSTTPSPELLNTGFRFGSLSLTVLGDRKGPGLSWAVLAVLAQGMLERTRRGWTNTWDGTLWSPEGRTYRVFLLVMGAEEGLQCEEELPSTSGSGSGGTSEGDEGTSTETCKRHKGGEIDAARAMSRYYPHQQIIIELGSSVARGTVGTKCELLDFRNAEELSNGTWLARSGHPSMPHSGRLIQLGSG